MQDWTCTLSAGSVQLSGLVPGCVPELCTSGPGVFGGLGSWRRHRLPEGTMSPFFSAFVFGGDSLRKSWRSNHGFPATSQRQVPVF